MAVRISGFEEAMKTLDRLPENVLKMSKQGMKEAAKPVAKQIRAGIQRPSFRRLVRTKVFSDGVDSVRCRVGLYHGKSKDEGVSDWFKAYWANYGTLTRRDPNHQFDNPIRRRSRRKNNVGQVAQNFFERAIAGAEEKFIKAFTEWFAKNEKRLKER